MGKKTISIDEELFHSLLNLSKNFCMWIDYSPNKLRRIKQEEYLALAIRAADHSRKLMRSHNARSRIVRRADGKGLVPRHNGT